MTNNLLKGIDMYKSLKLAKIWACACAVLLAVCLCVASPVTARATEVTRSVESAMTLTLQESSDSGSADTGGKGDGDKVIKPVAASEKGGGLPVTGDALFLALMGLVALGAGAAYCLLQSRKLNAVQGAHSRTTSRGLHSRVSQNDAEDTKKKVLAAAIAAVLLASTCFGGFASKTNALAETIGELVKSTSTATIDEQGNVLSSKVTVENSSSKTVNVKEVVAPNELSDWQASFDAQLIDAKSTLEGTWSGKTVPSNILMQLKNNGSVTLTFTTTITYENAETSGDTGKVVILDPTDGKDKTITVVDGDGKPIPGVIIEIDEDGKTNVIIPEDKKDSDVIIKIEDEEGNPVPDKKVEVKDEDGTSRGEGTTNDEGRVNYTELDFGSATFEGAVYDGTQQKPTVKMPGFVEGVDFEVVSWGDNINAGTGAGSATIKGIGTCSGEQTVTFDIAKAKLTVSGITATDRDYNGKTDVDLVYTNVQFTGLATGETVADGDLVVTGKGAMTDKSAGDNKAVKITELSLSGNKTNNYELATSGQQDSTTVKISKITVTVMGLTADNKQYDAKTDATISGAEASYTGKIDGDVLGIEAKGTFEDASVGNSKTVTISDVKLTGADAGNYDLATMSQGSTTADITKRKVKISGITAESKEYNGDATATVVWTSAVVSNKAEESDVVTVTGATGTFADSTTGAGDAKNVGTNKTVTISGLTLGGTDAGNYEVDEDNSQKEATANITAKAVELEWATTTSFTYNGKDQVLGATVKAASVCAGDATPTVTTDVMDGTSAASAHKDAGSYTATATALSDSNYALPSTNNTHDFTITAKELTLSWGAYTTAAYDGTAQAGPALTAETGIEGEKVSVSVTYKKGESDVDEAVNYGTYTVTADEISADSTTPSVKPGNYSLPSSKSTTFDINQREVTIQWGDTTLVYTGQAQAPEATAGNLVEGDELGLSVTGQQTNVGTNYTASVSAITGNDDNNYKLPSTGLSTTFSIVKAQYTVKYHGNGGTTSAGATETTQTITVGDGKQLDANPFTKTGDDSKTYGMLYWTTSEDGSGTKYRDKYSTSSADSGSDLATTMNAVVDLYAQWTEEELADYWIGTSKIITTGFTNATANQNNKYYNKPESGVVKTKSEIQADVEVLSDPDNEKYEEVKAEYQAYSDGDDFHLYTKWNGNTADYSGTSAENGYLEFRVIQVGSHSYNAAGDKDGSALTFEATHVMPQAYLENGTAGYTFSGWKNSIIRKLLVEGGDIYTNLDEGFVNDIMPVNKTSNNGKNDSTNWTTTSDKLWMLSRGELKGSYTGNYLPAYGSEGLIYDWYKKVEGDSPTAFYCINGRTRAGRCSQGQIDASYDYTIAWTRTGCLYGASFYSILYDAGKDYSSSAVINSPKESVRPAFCFGKSYAVTFLDGDDTLSTQQVAKGYAPTQPDEPTKEGYFFGGWYLDENCTAGKEAFDADGTWNGETITAEGTKVYCKWDKEDFWLGTTNTSATRKSDFAYDSNFRSSDDILADMKILGEGSSNTKYTETLNRWKGYYSSDLKLYSNYKGATGVNGLVEFRIMEISGEEGHLNVAGDSSSSDGSVVTFMATHLLPQTYAMNTSSTNVGGWSAMNLRTMLQSGGDIYKLFPTKLTDNIYATKKLNTAGGYSSAAGTTTEDKFWIPSYRELATKNFYSVLAEQYEGSPYQWSKDKAIDGSSTNASLVYKSRDSSTIAAISWWLRSPNVGNTTYWGHVYSDGAYSSNYASSKYGVVLCFSFGSSKVTFDVNAPSDTTATVDGSNSTTTITTGSTLSAGDVASISDKPTCSDSTYTFAGWATTPGAGVDDVDATSTAGLVGKAVTGKKTYYAVWKDTNTALNTGFWMSDTDSTKGTQESYYTSKSHYLSSKQILADVAVMKAGSSNSQYDRVIEKWNEYYEGDLRLYSTWSGSDASSGTVNSLVEFRILQVGEHDSDGSVVTFGATHALPTAKGMNNPISGSGQSGTISNAGGWESSEMRSSVMSNYVQAGLSSSLVSAMKAVQKVTTSGSYGSWVTGSTTTDTIWLLSCSEVLGTAAQGNTTISGTKQYFKDEGSRYAWFTDQGVNATSGVNSYNIPINALYKTRAASTAAGKTGDYWWLRSPWVDTNNSFGMISSAGGVTGNISNPSYAVVPCFCF